MEVVASISGVKEQWMETLAVDVLTFISGESADKVRKSGDNMVIRFSALEEYYNEAMTTGLWERYAERRLMNGMRLNVEVVK